MDNPILDEIVMDLAAKLNAQFGFCGLLNSTDMAILNTDAGDGTDIKITFKVEEAE